MKALFEDIESRKGNQAFLAYQIRLPSFAFRWHYHPEYELTLITQGSGKRLVGDSYQPFEAGDLVLLGPDLPHTWVSNTAKKRKQVSAVVIQFSEPFIQRFLGLSEFRQVGMLLAAASRGLQFSSRALADEIVQLAEKSGVEKLAGLLLILQRLTAQKPRKLASDYFRPVRGSENEKRINIICQYLQKHAAEKILLDKVAALVHLSRSAFCKFFKRATGKTLSDYVNDLRIGNASELLIETDLPINEIAYQAGFDSLTYFNRIFFKKKEMTPRQFRNAIRSKG
ncbi:MAG: AraC family transcriptional regulator [Chitinophagaceae bacterium]|jgi:AraC-like DNA-binding protein|nr:AraC family transcriptional regulator [Chitinophagaceae bacterium]